MRIKLKNKKYELFCIPNKQCDWFRHNTKVQTAQGELVLMYACGNPDNKESYELLSCSKEDCPLLKKRFTLFPKYGKDVKWD